MRIDRLLAGTKENSKRKSVERLVSLFKSFHRELKGEKR